MTILLRVQDLYISYQARHARVTAVRGVTLEIERGRVIGLVGESGSGKSTLGLGLIRLLPTGGRIDSGRILLDGQDLCRMKTREIYKVRGQRVAMIFQNPMTALNPVITVGDQIAEGLRYHTDLPGDALQKRVHELLGQVGISNARGRSRQYPLEFSGGMRQRIMIAIALALNPDLLIADEPTTALDLTIQAQILWLLQELQAQLGMAMLYITHDLEVAASLCDEIAVMYGGYLVEQALTDDLFKEPAHPYTRLLIEAVPRNHWTTGRITAIPGEPPSLESQAVGCPFAQRCPLVTDLCWRVMPEPEPVTTEGHWVRCHHWKQA